MRVEQARKQEMRDIGRKLATVSEEREGGEEANDSDLDKKEYLAKNLKA